MIAMALIWSIPGSKPISQRNKSCLDSIAEAIKVCATDWGIGKVEASEIDENGMTWANQEAFRRAMSACTSGLKPTLILIDGILGLPSDEIKFQCIAGGDGLYLPIAAASILAKVSRDTFVKEWSSLEENKNISERYGLLKNKGYGTAKHREGLKTHGPHEMHRKQFIRNWI